MTSIAGRAVVFDASALVKNYVDEIGSDNVRAAIRSESTWYTTPFCFYETLACLKRKLFDKDRARYLYACKHLTSDYRTRKRHVKDPPFEEVNTLSQVLRIVEKHGIDVSDAYQIVCVKEGFFSVLAGDSKTILATADDGLASAACSEGLKVWHVLRDQNCDQMMAPVQAGG